MQRLSRRAGRSRRALLVRLCVGLAVLLLPATFPLTAASFTGSTADDGNSVAAAEVAAPSGLGVTQSCSPAATIAFRAASSATGVDSLTLPTPSGTTAGDVLVAQVANRYTAYTLTAPSGWTLVRRDTSGSAVTSAVFWRVATSSEPASATFSLSGTSGVQTVGGVVAYSGVRASSPVDVSGVSAGVGDTATTPSVTTTVANTRVVHLLTKRQETLPAPTGTTQRWRLISGTGTATEGATAGDEPFVGPGSTAGRTSTAGTFQAEWLAQTVALRPANGTPSANLTWTASPSTWATGYRLERSVGATVQATSTVTPISATSATDGPLVNGTTYSYRLWAYYGTWTSPAITATLTPSC